MSSGSRIKKLLVANRGEIALRVMRTARRLGMVTVAVHSAVDAQAPFVRFADEAICIGGAAAKESYLNVEALLQACRQTHADALHPGYGFLSENADFADAVEAAGLRFVGPTGASIRAVGSKAQAKRLLSAGEYAAYVPLIPGYNGYDQSLDALMREAERVGYPLLIKASAGGGGKGMRIVRQPSELRSELEGAKREAANSFGDDHVLLERYFDSVRHVEFQIFGDAHGNMTHLYERDCSIQRRYQKIIEETPSPALSEELRERMGKAAMVIGAAIQYRGAGTVEFILDDSTGEFYFLEVNTRLQVEHPITEVITGLDLVEAQLRIAEGATLESLFGPSLRPPRSGHALEVRLYCEDPLNNFLPSVGRLDLFLPHQIPGLRYDSGVESGSEVSMYYDPMICKIIAGGATRQEVLQKMIAALRHLVVFGNNITTNHYFLLQVLNHPEFEAGRYNTHFIANYLPPPAIRQYLEDYFLGGPELKHVITPALLTDWAVRFASRSLWKHSTPGYRNSPASLQFETFEVNRTSYRVEYRALPPSHAESLARHQALTAAAPSSTELTYQFFIKFFGEEYVASLHVRASDWASLAGGAGAGDFFHRIAFSLHNGPRREFSVFRYTKHQKMFYFVHHATLGGYLMRKKPRLEVADNADDADTGGVYKASMAGKVAKVLVAVGESVVLHSAVIVLESMKMESKLLARSAGVVESVAVKEGQIVQEGDVLLTLSLPAAPAQ